jgi:Ca2+-binding EF-hand superfamily protein
MAAGATTTVMELTENQIQACFTKYDADSSGDLDTFELSNAVTELLDGVVPTTSQVMAMVALSGAQDNKLTREQFSSLIQRFDWGSAAATAALGSSFYEHVFPDTSLGFRVRSVAGRGLIVVSKVVDPSLAGFISENDTVLAVNGAPLGFVTDHKVLQEKIKPLRRPVRVTFEKYAESSGLSVAAGHSPSTLRAAPLDDSAAGEESQSSQTAAAVATSEPGITSSSGAAAAAAAMTAEAVAEAVAGLLGPPSPRSTETNEAVAAGRRRADADAAEEEAASGSGSPNRRVHSAGSSIDSGGPPAAAASFGQWSHEALYAAFQTYDRDRSGNLDTFELGPCLADLLGAPPSTAVMHALVDR